MKACGIIVEYNPFHNGHLYHIKKAKEITNCDILIAITSTNFVQRGELSCLDKWLKTQIALDHGVDIVVELPYLYTVQNADIFAKGAVDTLALFDIDNIVFGSESNNLDNLQKIVSISKTIEFNERIKNYLDLGLSYPKSFDLSLNDLLDLNLKQPNDILGIAYLKALEKYQIIPYTIQRTNNYHSLDLDQDIVSASAIRNAIKNKEDISRFTPIAPLLKNKDVKNIEDCYDYLKNLILIGDDLEHILLVDEGINGLIKKNILKYDNYQDFIKNTITKRYSKAKINRILIHILTNTKKQDLPKLEHARILGFSANGQSYLRFLNNPALITNFKKLPEQIKNSELKATTAYAYLTNDIALIKKEYQQIPLNKKP